MDKETGDSVQVDGEPIVTEKMFTAKSSEGKIEVLLNWTLLPLKVSRS